MQSAKELADKLPKVIKQQQIGDYLMLDYRYADWELFSNYPESREFRGIVYDVRNGDIVSRPFHKFFNLGEVPETTDIDLVGAMYAVKHDGSMAQVTYYDGAVFVASRSSMVGYVTQDVTPLILSNSSLCELLKQKSDYTFLFEYEDAKMQSTIVIPHDVTRLVYLVARHKQTGVYCFDFIKEVTTCGVECVQYKVIESQEHLDSLMAEAEQDRLEGYVLWTKGAGPIKIKAKWYVQAHRLVSQYQPKSWVESWANDTLDDVLAMLGQLQQYRLKNEVVSFIYTAMLPTLSDRTRQVLDTMIVSCRKDTAIWLKHNLSEDSAIDSLLFSAIMKLFGSPEGVTEGSVLESIKSTLKTSPPKVARLVDEIQKLTQRAV